jgi:hypothetical protein
MRIRKELYDEDQKVKRQRIEETEKALESKAISELGPQPQGLEGIKISK